MVSACFPRCLVQNRAKIPFHSQYDLVFEAEMPELTETGTGLTRLIVESHDEGYIAKIIHDGAGSGFVEHGTPLAILCEEEEDIEKFTAYQPEHTTGEGEVEDFLWQAYLSDKT